MTSKDLNLTTVPLDCACANIRRLARVVTKLYDQDLKDSGLEISQFTLLMALKRTGEITQGQLGAALALDSTTLTRSLKPLVQEGWIKSRPGDDRRERLLNLSPSGKQKFDRVNPQWERAQARLKKAVKSDGWNQMMKVLDTVTQASLTAEKNE
jgi:DNA-binding MarR family transcriptional regulator